VLLLLCALAFAPWALAPLRRHRGARVLVRWRPRVPRRRAGASAARAAGDVDAAMLLDLADAALAAGASVPRALTGVGRALPHGGTGRDLETAGALLALGAPWPDAWRDAGDESTALAEALEPAWRDGADPAPLLRRGAGAIRARRHRQAHEDAARLGVRLVLPLGLCLLPAFVLLGLVPVLLSGGTALVGG